jgi:hypothetical protein
LGQEIAYATYSFSIFFFENQTAATLFKKWQHHMPTGSQDTSAVPLPKHYNTYYRSPLSLIYAQRHYMSDVHALPRNQQILEEEA